MMEPTIAKMLDDEYERTLRDVSNAKAGSDEAQWQLRKLTELHKQRMDEQKSANEAYAQAKELSLKEAQAKDGKKDRIIRIVMDSAGIVLPLAASCFWMAKGLRFEETGSYTSRTGQWLSSHLRLFRK